MNENGGWDISFTIQNFASGYVELQSADTAVEGGTAGFSVRFGPQAGDTILVTLHDGAGTQLMGAHIPYTQVARTAAGINLRVLAHDEFITVYRNKDAWMETFALNYMLYADDPALVFSNQSGQILTVTELVVRELDDWREAIWVDMENDAAAAVGAVIQERPVEYVGQQDGAISFFYYPATRSIVELTNWPESHGTSYKLIRGVSSDAIVHGLDVAVILDAEAAKQFGFVTRVIRVPNLDSGYVKVAKVLQRKARQSVEQHKAAARFAPQLEIGDAVRLTYTKKGSGHQVQEEFIVETLEVGIVPEARMRISGRSNYDTYSTVPRLP